MSAAKPTPPSKFHYAKWRKGGWYVDEIQYPEGGCGCVSRNYDDRKWRIACHPAPFEEQPTFKTRDEAALAEWHLVQELKDKAKMMQYFEIKAAVDFGDETESYVGEPVWCPERETNVFTAKGALTEAKAEMEKRGGKSLFWTLYIRTGKGPATALGDFSKFEGAHEALSEILAPMRFAADKHGDSTLDDICNQSSMPDRL